MEIGGYYHMAMLILLWKNHLISKNFKILINYFFINIFIFTNSDQLMKQSQVATNAIKAVNGK